MSAELLTADELAALLHLRPSTLRDWGRRGRIPTVRLSPKVVRYDPVAVIAALKSVNSSASAQTLIAELAAAIRLGDHGRARAARDKLQSQHGITLLFGNELECRKGVADGE